MALQFLKDGLFTGTLTVQDRRSTASQALVYIDGKRTNSTDGSFGELVFLNNGDSVATVAAFRDTADDKGSLVFQTQNGAAGFGTRLTIGADGNATFANNIYGNSSNTTEIGAYDSSVSPAVTAAIKRIRMAQGGEIHFGDTTALAPLGITEGNWDSFGDSDFLSIYGRSSIRLYSGATASANMLRLTLNTSSNFEGNVNLTDGDLTITNTNSNPKINLIENSGGTQNAAIEFDQAGENALYISTNYISPSDSNKILLQPGSYPALTASGGANGSINSKVQILGTLQADRNIQTPNSDLSSTAAPTNFGVYTSEIRLIETPNGGLKQCRVITDNYGEWILVGRFAANAMTTIQSVWSSESGLDTSTSQSTTTKFSADFGDSYPTEVRIMGATDFTKWRDTRTVDFIYGVPEGRQWKFFFSGGVENGMAVSTKYGWGINGAYDGFGRWVNPAQNFVRMADTSALVINPSAAYTTATANAFNWDNADDAKITVSATRVFSGQDTFVTSGFGADDNVQGFFDEYPNETNDMGGGADFSSSVWVLIKLPNASSGGGGGGDTFWSETGTDIYNTNSGNVGVGTSSPDNLLTIASGTGGGSAPDSRTVLHIDKDGEAYISINSPADSFNGIRLNVAGTPTAFMELYDNTAQGKKLSIGTTDARDLVFNTGNQPKMVILAGGDVGIGATTVTQTGFWFDTTNNYLSINKWTASTATPAAMLHLFGGDNDIDVPAIIIEGRDNLNDTRLKIAVKDPQVRFLLDEGSDAANGYGLMTFETTAQPNAAASERGGFDFDLPGGTAMTILNTGNVGVGTSSPGDVRLFVENTSASTDPVFETSLDTTYNMGISNRWVSTTVSKLKIGRSGTAAAEVSSMDFIYDIAGAEYGSIKRNFVSSSLKFERSTSTDMIIDGSGNVGIGKTTSLTSHRLSVLKGASNQQLGLFYDETNFAAIGARSNGDVQIYGYGGGALANILLAVDGSAVGANVGIATTSPTAKLDISGDSSGVSVRIKGDQTTAGTYYYGFMHDGTNMRGTTQTNVFYAGGSVLANTTIATWASLRIDAPSVAATNATITNNYGIYQESNLQRNTFNGSVSVGTNSNASTFVVQGNSYFKKDHGNTWVADFHNISADYQGVRIRQDSTSGSGGPGPSGNSALLIDDERIDNMVTPTPTVYIKRSGANTNGLLLSVEPHAVTGLTVNDAGRVGIGTEAPDAQLEVETASYANTNAVANFVNGNNPTRVAYDTVVVAQTDVASLSIVETPAGGQSVEQKLTLSVGDASAVIRSTSTATNGMYFLVGASTSAPAYQTTSGVLGIRILNSGFVGVGANTPRSKLEIFRAAGSSGTPQLIISTGEASSRDYSFGTDVMAAGDFAILDGVTSTVANVRMRFVDGGTLIGFRDNNTTELGTYSTGAIKRIRMCQGGEIHFGDTSTSNPCGITEGTWDSFGDSDLMSIYARNRLDIYAYPTGNTISASFVSGTFTAVGDVVAYGSPSDKRLKENIKPIESALDKVNKLQGVTFDWKKSDSILEIKEDIGFIAQDVQKVIPELVRENEDGMLSMRHQGIAPILLEAIKELKAEIDLLKSKPCTCNKCNCNI